jgi:hypothetical protein
VSHDSDLRKILSFELGQIRKELQVLHRVAGTRRRLGGDEVRVRAAASSLQSIYNGMEKMLGLVLKEKGKAPTESSASHSELLHTAVAAGILSEELAGQKARGSHPAVDQRGNCRGECLSKLPRVSGKSLVAAFDSAADRANSCLKWDCPVRLIICSPESVSSFST